MSKNAYDVFISYRRGGGSEFARLLQRCLQDQGVSVFLDVDSLDAGHFDEHLLLTIQESRNVIVVLSRDCLRRCVDEADWFRREISTALQARKNLVPVMLDGFEYPPVENLPEPIRELPRHQSVRWSHEYFDAMIGKILNYIGVGAEAKIDHRSTSSSAFQDFDRRVNSLNNAFVRISTRHQAGQEGCSKLFISKVTVSNSDYLQFVRAGGAPPGSGRKTDPSSETVPRTRIADQCPDTMLAHPVIYVTQADARNFCLWLTTREREAGMLGPDDYYTLPSFDQWVAVARNFRIDVRNVLGRYWVEGGSQPTEPIDKDSRSNQSGICHLFGNVFEWCLDEKMKKPRRESKANQRIPYYLMLGGGWASDAQWLSESIAQGVYGSVWCPYGWMMKDCGFRLWLRVNSKN